MRTTRGSRTSARAARRTGDSWLKPDVTAPGVSVTSTLVGSGNEGTIISGTSMASPAVAGIAALVKQAHPKWSSREIKNAIVNTGEPSGVTNYRTSRGGTGLANALSAVQTQVLATGDQRTGSLSFGFSELASDFSGKKSIEIRNWGTAAVTLGGLADEHLRIAAFGVLQRSVGDGRCGREGDARRDAQRAGGHGR